MTISEKPTRLPGAGSRGRPPSRMDSPRTPRSGTQSKTSASQPPNRMESPRQGSTQSRTSSVPYARMEPSKTPREQGSEGNYALEGPGLTLCAPKVQTFFRIRQNSSESKMKVSEVKVNFKGPAAVKSEIVLEKGGIVVRYIAPMSGDYRASVSVGQVSLNRGNMIGIKCQAPRPDENTSKVSLNDRIGFVDEVYRARIECYDQFGDKWTTGGYPIDANVLDSGVVLHAADVHDIGDGNFEVSFVPRVSAVYQLSIILDGSRSLAGSPFDIRVKSDETIPAKSKLLGTGLVQGVASETNTFSIQACDGKGKMRRVGGDIFDIVITDPLGHNVSSSVYDKLDGTYDVTWESNVAGVHRIRALLEDAVVGGTEHECKILPTTLDPKKCVLSGPGLGSARAGVEVSFSVRASDKFGNVREVGGDVISALLFQGGRDHGHDGKPMRVDDLGGGNYRISYTASFTGDHDIVVYASGNEVAGSPARVVVTAGEVSPASSRLYGPGVSAVALGRPSKLFIDLSDNFGNKVVADSIEQEGVKVRVEGPGPCTVTAVPGQDGVHSYTYLANTPGTYHITAVAGEQHLRGSPASVTASTAKACPQLCEVVGTPLDLKGVAGTPSLFHIIAKDADGTQKSVGGDIFTCTWSAIGGDGTVQTGKFHDEGNGEYNCAFQATATGAYEVSVKNQDEHIAGSPFSATVAPGKVHPTTCRVLGDALAGQMRCNQLATVSICPSDTYSNLIKATEAICQGFRVDVQGPAGPLHVVILPAAESGGQLVAQFTPTVVGKHSISCQHEGQHISSSPWESMAWPDVATARYSAISGLPKAFTAGRPERLVIVAKDSHGNRTCGGDTVIVETDSANAGPLLLTATDENDGSYTATVSADRAGLITIAAKINGELLELPATLPVIPGPMHVLKFLSPNSVECTAGQSFSASFAAFDTHGNRLSIGGDKLQAHALQGDASTPASVSDLGDGTYLVSAKVFSAGSLELSVAASETAGAIGQARLNVLCHPAAAAPEKCSVELPSEPITAGTKGRLLVRKADAFCNPITAPSTKAQFVAHVMGSNGSDMTIELGETQAGTAEVVFSSPVAGTYQIQVKDSESQAVVAGSPFLVDICAGKLSPEKSTASWAAGQHGTLVAGGEVSIDVIGKDYYGNSAMCPPSDIEVVAQGPSSVALEAPGPGAPAYRVRLTQAGTYSFGVSISGTPLKGWPRSVHVAPAAANAKKCVLSGAVLAGSAAVQVGSAVNLMLTTADAHGNLLSSGSSLVDVPVAGPEGSSVTMASVLDLGDGTYRISLAPDVPGAWKISPSVGGTAISQAGFQLQARWGSVCPSDLLITGGEGFADGSAGQSAQLRIAAAGGIPRNISSVAGAVAVLLRCPSGAVQSLPLLVAAGGQSLVSSCTWAEVGQHSIIAMLDGQTLPGSPLVSSIAPGLLDLHLCRTYGAALEGPCVAGSPSSFLLSTFDSQGNSCPAQGLAVTVAGEAAKVTADVPGTALVSFTPVKSGAAEVSITNKADGSETCRSLVVVPGPPSALESDLEAPTSEATAGTQIVLALRLRDRHGNTVLACSSSDVAVDVEGPGPAEAVVSRGSTGEMLIGITAKVAGDYSIAIKLAGVEVTGSPAQLKVLPGVPDVRKCTVSVHQPLVEAGSDCCVLVTLCDAHGNPTAPVEGVEVFARLSSSPAEIAFAGASPNALKAQLHTAGEYAVVAKVDGEALQAHLCTVVPGPLSAEQCRVLGLSDSKQLLVGTRASYTLQAYDRSGNPLVVGGGAVAARLTDCTSGKELDVSIIDYANGQYGLTFTPTRAGDLSLMVTVDSKRIMQEAIPLHSSFPPLNAGSMHVVSSDGSRSCKSVAGEEVTLYVQALELEARGRKCSGKELLAVRVIAPSGAVVPSQLTHLAEEGRYDVRVTLVEAGEHRVEAAVNGEDLTGAEVEVAPVAPGAVCPGRCSMLGATTGLMGGVTVGEAKVLVLGTCDEEGRALVAGGCSVKATVTCLADKHEVKCAVQDKCNGQYLLAVVTDAPGKWELMVEVGGSRIQQEVIPLHSSFPPLDAGSMHVVSSDGSRSCKSVAGEEVTLYVQALELEARGRKCSGKELLAARVIAPSGAVVPSQLTHLAEEGRYDVRVTLVEAGEHRVEAAVNGEDLTGAVVEVAPVAPGAVCPGRCSVLGAMTGLMSGVTVGEAKVLVLGTCDEEGRALVAGGCSVKATVTCLADKHEVKCAVQDKCNGQYLLAVVTDAPGKWVLMVEVGGSRIQQEVIPLHSSFPPLDAGSMHVVSSDGSRSCKSVAGEEVTLYVQALELEARGRKCSGKELLAARVIAPSGAVVPSQLTHLAEEGRYDVRVTLVEAGEHRVEAAVNGEDLTGAVVEVAPVAPGAVCPGRCSVLGAMTGLMSGVTVGEAKVLVLGTCDEEGRALVAGGCSVKATVTCLADKHEVKCAVQDKCNGQYLLAVVTDAPGKWELMVEVGGSRIQQEVIPLHSSFPPLDAGSMRVVSSDGSRSCKSVAGEEVTLYVQALELEARGRKCSGKELLAARVIAPSGAVVPSQLTHLAEEGRYDVRVTLVEAGEHRVEAAVNGEDMTGAVVEVAPVAPGAVCPGRCSVLGAMTGLMSGVTVGEAKVLVLGTCDEEGRALVAGGCSVKATVTCLADKHEVKCAVQDKCNGQYLLAVVTDAPGKWELMVEVGGGRIQQEVIPLHSSFPPLDAGSMHVVSSDGSRSCKSVAGEEVTLYVQALELEARGRKCSGKELLAARVIAPSGAVVPSQLTHLAEEGRYDVRVTLVEAGEHRVEAAVNGEDMTGAVVEVAPVAPGAVCPGRCSVLGAMTGLMSGVTVGEAKVLVLGTCDEEGRALVSGGCSVRAVVTCLADKHELKCVIEDKSNGQYLLAVVTDAPGEWELVVEVEGSRIQQVSIPLSATFGPLGASDLQMESAHTDAAPAMAGQPLKSIIKPKLWQAGRWCSGLEPLSAVFITPSKAVMPVQLVYNSIDGKYELSATPTSSGPYQLQVAMAGAEVGGLVVPVAPGPIALESCRLTAREGQAVDHCTAGAVKSMLLIAYDVFGNRITAGGAEPTVHLLQEDGTGAVSAAAVVDKQDGTYAISYTLTTAGSYRLSVTIDGCPSSLTSVCECLPAEADASMSVIEGNTAGPVLAGSSNELRVLSRDAFGNRVLTYDHTPDVQSVAEEGMEVTVEKLQNGVTRLCYTPKVAGAYKLKVVSTGGVPVGSGEAQVTVVPEQASLCKSKAEFCDETLVVDGDLCISVGLSDVFGNLTDSTKDEELSVSFSGPESRALQGLHTGVGIWSFTGQLRLAGTYQVRACLGGKALPGWPKSLHVSAADSTNIHSCRLERLPSSSFAGEECHALVSGSDLHGNPICGGGADVTLKAYSPDAVEEEADVAVTDFGNGTYGAAFTPTTAGTWTLVPIIGGVKMTSAATKVAVGDPELKAEDLVLKVSNPKVPVCGSELRLEVKAMKAKQLDPWLTPVVRLTSPSGRSLAVPMVLSAAKDAFQGAVLLSEPGAHSVCASLAGQGLQESPLELYVAAGALHPPSCVVTGLPGESETSLQTIEVLVEGRDALGNPAVLDASLVLLETTPPGLVHNLQLSQQQLCAVKVTGETAGDCNLALRVEGQEIRPSGLSLKHPGCTAQLALAPCSGAPSVITAQVGQLVAFPVELRSAQVGGPVLCCPSGVELEANVQWEEAPADGEEHQCDVVYLGLGRFSVSFAPDRCGTFLMRCSLSCDDTGALTICGTTEPGKMHAAACSLVGHTAGAMLSLRAGEVLSLRVQRRDALGHNVTNYSGQPAILAEAQGPGPLLCPSEDAPGGIVSVACSARIAGRYRLNLFTDIAHEAIGSEPVEIDVLPGPVSQDCCFYSMEGFQQDQPVVAAGEKLRIVVETRDKYGNALSVPAASIQAAAQSSQGSLNFQHLSTSDEGRLHTFEVMATTAGYMRISVNYVNQAAGSSFSVSPKGSPSSITVVPAVACPSTTLTSGIPEEMIAGVPSVFTVTPCDTWRNPGATGGAVCAQLIPATGGNALPCKVIEVGGTQRLFRVTASCSLAGEYSLGVHLELDGQTHTVASAEVVVKDAMTDGPHSNVSGFWPECGAVANAAAGFVVKAFDEFGNPRTRGGDTFTVELRGVDPLMINVMDHLDGTYSVQYTAPSEGTYPGSVKINGQHLRGSPLALTVFRDVPSLADREMERRLSTTVNTLRRGVGEARALHAAARAEMCNLQQFLPVMCDGVRVQVLDAIKGHESLLAESRAALSREAVERKRLHNLVQELRGNIRVYVRVKPLLADEGGTKQQSVLKCLDDRRLECTAMGSIKSFEFDRVYDDNTQQAEIFDDVGQLVTSALDGYNVCVFAYGQTGAGKTHTMEGPKNDPGINYRTIRELFRSISEERPDTKYDITCCMVEIYNEMVHDLLNETDTRKEMELQSCKTGFLVPSLSEQPVTSPDQIFEIMAAGFRHRAVGCHDVNAHSSRSHCLLIVNVNGTNLSTGVRTHGKLTLCDLAGSERVNKTGASGLTLTEAQNINSSLLALGNVISALLQQSSHVPYRNSKLTMLLQDSLGGDAKALMLCNVAQPAVYAQETLSSLVFASKVGNVVMKTPQRHLEDADAGDQAKESHGRTKPASSRKTIVPKSR